MHEGTLYIVATPIGNLEDITYRAVLTLKEVDFIACEDTRQTNKLLQHYGIKTRVFAFHAHNEQMATSKVLTMLAEGKNIALVSDAGTPVLSDPGSYFVAKTREAGHKVVPIPGPSALAALLSVAGNPAQKCSFEGFLSPKKGKRRKRLKELAERQERAIFFESPFRILKLLEDLNDIKPNAYVLLGREMTKIHEEFILGNPGQVLAKLGQMTKIKGEISLFVSFSGQGKDELYE